MMEEDTFITLRKKRLTNSLSNLTKLSFDSMNSTETFDVSALSLPNQSSHEYSMIESFRNQIKNLKSELEIAHEEIENLNFENTTLKRTIEKQEKALNLCKRIGLSDQNLNINTPIANRLRKIVKEDLHKSIRSGTPLKSHNASLYRGNKPFKEVSTPINNSKKDILINNSFTIKTKPNQNLIDVNSDILINTENINRQEKNNLLDTEKKIIILGDQQVKGLAVRLTNNRNKNHWNNNYIITGHVKPYAQCSDILENFKYFGTLTSKDRIFLSVGSNDKNPTLFIKNLTNALNNLQHTQVFILEIINNRFLNTNLLNYHIKNLVATYPNCKFISKNPRYSYFTQNFKNNFFENISYEIDAQDYEIKYIKHIKDIVIHQNMCSKPIKLNGLNGNTEKPLKGTIPYYFKIIKKDINYLPEEQNFHQKQVILSLT